MQNRSPGGSGPAGGGFLELTLILVVRTLLVAQVYELGKVPGVCVGGCGPLSRSGSSPGRQADELRLLLMKQTSRCAGSVFAQLLY